MSFDPLNSPWVRTILLDKTVKGTTPSGGSVPEPFRTPFQFGPPPGPLEALWEVDPQLLAEWEVSVPFSFCDPTQWEDVNQTSPPGPWELITPGSNAYEWDDTNQFVDSPITYIGTDALPNSIEVFYSYVDTDFAGAATVTWRWFDGSQLELASDSTFVSNGTGSFTIGAPPVGAETMQFEVSGPFFWGVGVYDVYLALGCSDAVWALPPVPAFDFCDPTQWQDVNTDTPPIHWEALATDNRYWFDDNVNSTGQLTYIGAADAPGSFDIAWEITQATSGFIIQVVVTLDGSPTTYDIGNTTGSGTITISPPTPTSTIVIGVRTDFGNQLYGDIVALGCPPV